LLMTPVGNWTSSTMIHSTSVVMICSERDRERERERERQREREDSESFVGWRDTLTVNSNTESEVLSNSMVAVRDSFVVAAAPGE
jgi:hypothetical protein